MTPIDLDDIVAKVLIGTGSAHVELIVTMPDCQTITHEAGKHPGHEDVYSMMDWALEIKRKMAAKGEGNETR